MNDKIQAVREHYEGAIPAGPAPAEQIRHLLDAGDAVGPEQLALMDQFHANRQNMSRASGSCAA